MFGSVGILRGIVKAPCGNYAQVSAHATKRKVQLRCVLVFAKQGKFTIGDTLNEAWVLFFDTMATQLVGHDCEYITE